MVVGPPMIDCTGEQNGGDARAGPDQPKSLNVTGFFTAAAPDRLIRA
jgi:hypothetical protein